MEITMKDNNWIVIRMRKSKGEVPSEICIDKNGTLFVDGELYDEKSTRYKNLNVSIDKFKKYNTGEETQKMIEQQKNAKKGETLVITDNRTPERTETTTIKY